MVDRLSVDNTLDGYLAHINNNSNYSNSIHDNNNNNSIHYNNNNVHDNNILDNNIHATNINNNSNSNNIYFISREELGRFIIHIKDETEYLDFLQLSLADWLEQGVYIYIYIYNIIIYNYYYI